MNPPSPSVPELAVARWISSGITSLTHPVLVRIQAECFGAIGIEADWFEAEPFSGVEAGMPDGWLRAPRWNPQRVDPRHPGAADLARWANRAGEITVTADGILRLPADGPAEADTWLAVRHSVAARGRAGAFLCAAAGSLLFDPITAAIYLAGNDDAFVQRIWARLGSARGGLDKSEPARASTGTRERKMGDPEESPVVEEQEQPGQASLTAS